MALNNYTELKKSIIEWSHREDADLQIPDFIKIAESEMYANDTQMLDSLHFEKTTTLTANAKEITLPSDFIEPINVKLDVGGNLLDIQYLAPQEMKEKNHNGTPTAYTVIGNRIRFNTTPVTSLSLQLDYLGELTPLSDENPQNDVLLKFPQIYLFGALWALKQWADEPQDSEVYYIRFIKAIKGANKKSKKARFGSSLQMRIKGSTP